MHWEKFLPKYSSVSVILFIDHISGESQQIHQCWVISNQIITKEAVEQLNVLLKSSGFDRNVSFIDGEKLRNLFVQYVSKPIFQVPNYHIPSCENPPYIDGKKSGQYLGYFENMLGEQTIFIFDQTTNRGMLYIGDAGWDQPFEVRYGTVSDLTMS